MIFRTGKIIYKKYIHIGVAVDTERGLLVPVIRDADKKSIFQLSIELGELAEKARKKKIKPDELQGGNIAISNLGGIGGTQFTPIVYQPNVAVIGVSRATTEPVFIDGEFKPRLILPLSLSYDHRLIDGAEGARFMKWLCDALENPFMIFFKGGKSMADSSKVQLVIIGAGPGGYACAFQASNLGLDVTLVDPRENPGGVCLFQGCIPTKALLHLAETKEEAMRADDWGLHFDEPAVDVEKVRTGKRKS